MSHMSILSLISDEKKKFYTLCFPNLRERIHTIIDFLTHLQFLDNIDNYS